MAFVFLLKLDDCSRLAEVRDAMLVYRVHTGLLPSLVRRLIGHASADNCQSRLLCKGVAFFPAVVVFPPSVSARFTSATKRPSLLPPRGDVCGRHSLRV